MAWYAVAVDEFGEVGFEEMFLSWNDARNFLLGNVVGMESMELDAGHTDSADQLGMIADTLENAPYHTVQWFEWTSDRTRYLWLNMKADEPTDEEIRTGESSIFYKEFD